ncbi:OmpA-like domain-containing protein [Azospirillaceae bacterium]
MGGEAKSESVTTRVVERRRKAFRGVLSVIVIALLWADAVCAETCDELRAQGEAAQRAGQTAVLEQIYDQVAAALDCSDGFRAQFGRLTARAIEKKVYAEISTGAPLEAYETALVGSLRYAKLWRVLAWLGDVEKGRRRYSAASLRYQEALATIQDETLTPAPPAPEVIAQIFRQAEQTRLLSESYVAAPTTRAGIPTGLAAVRVRGFVPTKVALPIEFQYNSVVFTDNGARAVEDLWSSLQAQKEPNITLVGHTDPIGSDEYNIDLSIRRAAAVKNWLLAKGYSGNIQTEGRGKREPPVVDDPSQYDVQQLYRLYRRVELQR